MTPGDFLPPILSKGVRWLRRRIIGSKADVFLRGGAVPWSPGYDAYRKHVIGQFLADESISACFRLGQRLPEGYGVGLDERCIEYPWLLANLPDGPGTLLDAGSCLNHEFLLATPQLAGRKMHILTLAPERAAYWPRGISYLYEDLRSIPIRDGFYDVVACLSTIEHVGCDNSQYTRSTTPDINRPDDYLAVMRELCRVLRPGGTLFLTVPFGIGRNFGAFWQFDRERLARAVEAFGPTSEVSERFYKYNREGWNIAGPEDCAACEYVTWLTLPNEQRPSSIPVESDKAAAARAVACVRIEKK